MPTSATIRTGTPSTSGGSTSRRTPSTTTRSPRISSVAPLNCAERISARRSPKVNGPWAGRRARPIATSARPIAAASVSMCAASESRASDEAAMPATTSTAMKPRISPSAIASLRAVGVGGDRVVVPVPWPAWSWAWLWAEADATTSRLRCAGAVRLAPGPAACLHEPDGGGGDRRGDRRAGPRRGRAGGRDRVRVGGGAAAGARAHPATRPASASTPTPTGWRWRARPRRRRARPRTAALAATAPEAGRPRARSTWWSTSRRRTPTAASPTRSASCARWPGPAGGAARRGLLDARAVGRSSCEALGGATADELPLGLDALRAAARAAGLEVERRPRPRSPTWRPTRRGWPQRPSASTTTTRPPTRGASASAARCRVAGRRSGSRCSPSGVPEGAYARIAVEQPIHDRLDLARARRPRSAARATYIAPSSSAPMQQVRERRDRLARDHAGVHPGLQRPGHQAEAVAQADLAPARPAQDGRRVEQHDALDLRVGAGVRNASAPARRASSGSAAPAASAPSAIARRRLGLDLLEDRLEQVLPCRGTGGRGRRA